MTSEIARCTIGAGFTVTHPEFGDMTQEVAAALQQITRADDAELAVQAEARQAALAKLYENGARLNRTMALKAVIDPRVHDYWVRREGPGFWKHELRNMQKRHPELRVKHVPDHPTLLVDGLKGTPLAASTLTPSATRSTRGGRWAA